MCVCVWMLINNGNIYSIDEPEKTEIYRSRTFKYSSHFLFRVYFIPSFIHSFAPIHIHTLTYIYIYSLDRIVFNFTASFAKKEIKKEGSTTFLNAPKNLEDLCDASAF